jgi:hypothetical protein
MKTYTAKPFNPNILWAWHPSTAPQFVGDYRRPLDDIEAIVVGEQTIHRRPGEVAFVGEGASFLHRVADEAGTAEPWHLQYRT